MAYEWKNICEVLKSRSEWPDPSSAFDWRLFKLDTLIFSHEIFVPRTEVISGLVFLSPPLVINPQERACAASDYNKHKDLERAELVHSFNWFDLESIFSEDPDKGPNSQTIISLLLESIERSWRIHLQAEYPDRSFQVRILPPEETGGWFGVGFAEQLALH